MAEIAEIGLDLAKTVFQVHGVPADGDVVVCRQLRRLQVLAFFEKLPLRLAGMEACASSHHWGRELTVSAPFQDWLSWPKQEWPTRAMSRPERAGSSHNRGAIDLRRLGYAVTVSFGGWAPMLPAMRFPFSR